METVGIGTIGFIVIAIATGLIKEKPPDSRHRIDGTRL